MWAWQKFSTAKLFSCTVLVLGRHVRWTTSVYNYCSYALYSLMQVKSAAPLKLWIQQKYTLAVGIIVLAHTHTHTHTHTHILTTYIYSWILLFWTDKLYFEWWSLSLWGRLHPWFIDTYSWQYLPVCFIFIFLLTSPSEWWHTLSRGLNDGFAHLLNWLQRLI